MDIFDRIASDFQKEARFSKGDTEAYEKWKEKLKKENPSAAESWGKYEGAFDPSTGEMNQERIKKNMGGDSRGKDISALGQLGKKSSFYDEEIIDDIGLERTSSYGYQTPEMRRNPKTWTSGGVAQRLQHLNSQKAKRRLTREEEMELRDLEERYSKSNLSAYARAFENRKSSFYDEEIIDDIGLERTASDREAELLADDLMVLADEIMSGKRRGPLKSSVRRAIGKGLRKALKGQGLKNRTKKTNRTLRKPRTQKSRADARVRKQRKYNRFSR